MKNSIFVSGPHGSGKTTLINFLLNEGALFQENSFDIDFTQEFPSIKTMNRFELCLLRLYHRIYAGRYANAQARNLPNKAIITSRSIYDSAAYIQSYKNMNWLTDDQTDKMKFIVDNCGETPQTIILNPPVEIIMQRLEKRRATGVRKTRDELFNYEDTVEFVTDMHKSFAAYKDLKNVLYIEDNGYNEIDAVLRWVNEQEPLVIQQAKECGGLSCLQVNA